MRLLSTALPRLARLVPPGRVLVTGLFAGLVVALECFGRVAANDWADGLAALALVAGVVLVGVRHKRQPLGWVRWLAGRAGRLVRLGYQHGHDLRGVPPYPARLPGVAWWAAGGLAGWAAVAGAVGLAVPGGLRGVLVQGSYVVYLTGLVVVWAALAAAALAGLYLPHFVYELAGGRRAGWAGRFVFLTAYLSAVGSLANLVPPVVPLVVAGLGAGLVVGRLARRKPDDAAFLWRRTAADPIAAVPSRLFMAAVATLAGLAAAAAVVTACGPRLVAWPAASPFRPADARPADLDGLVLSPALGQAAAWLMPGVVAAVAVSLAAARRSDPAARTPPTVQIAGDRPAPEAAAAARTVAGWGWRVRRPGGPPADVTVELVGPDQSEAHAFDAGWPLKAAVAELADPDVKDRLARRDELTLRKAALRGVTALFAKARAERKAGGGSFQFAPHWWFMPQMTREEPRRGRPGARHRAVGPPLSRVFTPRVRQHLHAVLRAAEIDLILVEDGVGPKRVGRVFRALFDLHDRHRGLRRAEEHVFRGIPRVRVMIHDYAPGQPYRATRYAEPHLDELDRARVLHVFRDTGDSEIDAADPANFHWEPSPALSFD